MLKKYTTTLVASLCLFGAISLSSCAQSQDYKIEIFFFTKTFNTWADNYIKNACEEFSKTNKDGIKVTNRMFYSFADYQTAIQTAEENGYPPELRLMTYASLPNEVIKGSLRSVGEYLSEGELNQFYDSAIENVKVKDDIYMFPWYTEPSAVMYYRKDILASNGINVPTTVNELYSACEKLRPTLDIVQYPFAMAVTQGDCAGFTHGLQYNYTNGLLLNDEWTEHRLDHEGFEELAEFYYNMANRQYIPKADITSDGYANMAVSLCREKPLSVMALSGSWAISELYNSYPEYVEKIGVAPVPTLEKNASRTSACNGGWGFGISSSASDEAALAAAKFVKWLSLDDVENSAEYFNIEHLAKYPASKTVTEYLKSQDDLGIDPTWLTTVENISANAIREPLYSIDISYAYGYLLQSMVLNKENKTFDEIFPGALQTAKNKINKIISKDDFVNPYL